MKVVVFGASGKVGTRVVEVLLQDGHEVTAVVHSHNPFDESPHLLVKQLDVHNKKAVAEVLEGAQAVVSCLSSWGSENGDVLSSAMHAIIPAMKKHGVTRIVSLTGNAAFTKTDKPSIAQQTARAVLLKANQDVILDGEEHIRLLQKSHLDWTIIRSPVMNTVGSEGYRLSSKLSGATSSIHRQAVAQSLVDQLTDGRWLRQAPIIWRA